MPVIVTIPTFIASTWRDSLGLKLSPVPLDVPTHEVAVSWTCANENDAGLRWLVTEMTSAFS
jgi:LysR family transcriptional activator of mexEF-oprN operon